MPTPNFSEIAATTIENRSGVIADNVLKNVAFLDYVKKRGNVKPFPGGRSIVQELFFAENTTYKRYSAYDSLDVNPSEVITAAEYDIKQAAVAVSWSGLDEIMNAGEEQMIDMVEAKIQNAETSMINGLAGDAYSNGTADSGRQLTGLQAQIPDNPATGKVGNIDRALWSFWKSKKFGGVADGGAAVDVTNIQGFMRRLFTQLVRGPEGPDVLVGDDNYWGMYHDSLTAHQRITDVNVAQSGWQTLKFMKADFLLDGGMGGMCPANHIYMINSKYLFWRTAKGRDMKTLKDRNPTQQDATVRIVVWAGNLTSNFLGAHGVLIA